MKVLITGNMGYVGSRLVNHLSKSQPDYRLIGIDSGFFGHLLTDVSSLPEIKLEAQYFCDIRDISDAILERVDAVVHLAAISNDPMGMRFEAVTDEVNHRATVCLAKRSIALGVKRFVFASSCSIYGYAEGGPRREFDSINPLTAYAKSKVLAEQAFSSLDLNNVVFTSLRFATACGSSERLRLDLVLNDFVASAVSRGEIVVLSDGTPWRPLIAVNDMCRAISWALEREPDISGNYLELNVGSDEWNFQISHLAQAVADVIPGTVVKINHNAPQDRRSYKVDFSLFKELAPCHQPLADLNGTIADLQTTVRAMALKSSDFRTSHYMRLKVLESHVENDLLTEDLRWRSAKFDK
jgi:nucleoside-diphosphate-sugar epimerase